MKSEKSENKESVLSAASANVGFTIQRKLAIGAINDSLEHEADAMADKVMRMPEQNFIQRKCTHCDEEEKLQRKPIASFVQKKESANDNVVASDAISRQIQSSKGGGNSMSATTKSFMESRFGTDFSDVRIHSNNNAAQLSTQLNAKAFTVGNDVYFNEGKYQPESSNGKHLLAHELTHTVQQKSTSSIINRQLFTPLGAGGGFAGVMDRDRARVRQMTSPKPPITIQKIKVWFNTFIPQYIVAGPPLHDCFLGDNRTFGNSLSVPSRTHQEMEFEMPSLNVVSDIKRIGTTHEVDCKTAALEDSATASTKEIYTTAPVPGPVTRYSANEVLVAVIVDASNPLVTGAPAINAIAIFHIDPYNRFCYLTGVHDGFPAYEAYVSADGGTASSVYNFDPQKVGNGISALFPPMDVTINSSGNRF